MARVLIPVMQRRYDMNPRGSATAQVVMRSNNPFERPTRIVNSTRSMLPGMGYLGADPAPAPAPAATGFDMSALLNQLTTAGVQVAQGAATAGINKALGVKPIVQMPTPPINILPGQVGASLPIVIAPKRPKTMWLVAGGIGIVGLGALWYFTRKKGRK